MIKQETFKILKQTANFYDKFTFDQEKVDAWHHVLKNFPYEKVQENLFAYVPRSKEPPCLSDLIRPGDSRTIPNAKETQAYLNLNYVPATKEQVEKHLANIRSILNIERRAADGQF